MSHENAPKSREICLCPTIVLVKAEKCAISLGKIEKSNTSLFLNDYPPATNE